MTNLATTCAVLWDLDGTLVDSAEYHWQAWCEALTAAGHSFDKGYLVATFGQRNDRILRAMLGQTRPARRSSASPTTRGAVVSWCESVGSNCCPAPSFGSNGCVAPAGGSRWRPPCRRQRGDNGGGARPGRILRHDRRSGGRAARQTRSAGVLHGRRQLSVPSYRCVVVENAAAGVERARSAGMRSSGAGQARRTGRQPGRVLAGRAARRCVRGASGPDRFLATILDEAGPAHALTTTGNCTAYEARSHQIHKVH